MDHDDEDMAPLEEPFARSGDGHESEAIASGNFACDNCRQRKVKCDRTYPCSHCVKIKIQCTYSADQKPRIRRQRVFISNTYETKLDKLAQKIEDLTRCVSQLTVAQASGASSAAAAAATAPGPSRSNPSPHSIHPTPSSSAATPADPVPIVVNTQEQNVASKPEYEGESSLFAHAVFATRFLQNAIKNNPSSEIAQEMNSVLDALRNTVDTQKQQTDTLESLYPNARPLPPGASLRQLPSPSVDRALACLRMAQESARVQALWFMEFQTVGQFTAHFIKVCSPGPATEAELIIVYAGLYWLFLECSNAVKDPKVKQEYSEQAILCRDNLETVLSRLPFHQPATLDNAYALSMAGLYCLQKCKSSAAWTFICMASHQTQALGLHNAVSLQGEPPETKRYKMWLFWLIYTIEKVLSLRMGRSSTIRDSDITLPREGHEFSPDSWWSEVFPIWIALSTLQGRIFDEIYSPNSLAQPEEIRSARAKAIAAEARKFIQAQDDLQAKYNDLRNQTLGAGLNELLWRADRVTSFSMLTLIYRGIPSDKPGSSVFCDDCIAAARDTLIEHEKCLTILSDKELQSDYFEFYVAWALLQSPFIPFIVVFCHIIETSDPSDLYYLQRLVETLQLASNSTSYIICQRHLRIFKALYDVAVKYFEARAHKTDNMIRPPALGFNPYPSTFNADQFRANAPGEFDDAVDAGSVMIGPGAELTPDSTAFGLRPIQGTQQNQMPAEFGPPDAPGTELAAWFYTNHEMMRMLGDM